MNIDKTVVDLFGEQAARTPEQVAVVYEGQELTYGELDRRSNQLGRYLRKRGVREETLVPICLDRSIEMIVGILGIMKAGGAYVPMDPAYPVERLRYMLEDTGGRVVVSSEEYAELMVSAGTEELIVPDVEWKEIGEERGSKIETGPGPEHLAYVIYTSGSTGRPKGVMIEHKSLVNYLSDAKARYCSSGIETRGSFIHLSLSFDASVTGLFVPLISGKSIVIGSGKDTEVFTDELFRKYSPYDFVKLTPAHMPLLEAAINDSDKLFANKLVLGGEALQPHHFQYLLDKGITIEVINEYGPTEATVGCTTYSFITGEDMSLFRHGVPIGKPMDNLEIYILGSDKELLPLGVWGEICIGGEGLARGYLNQPQLTAEKFVPNPFRPGERLYRTGDLGRWLSDGNIEYLGRKDEQLKIRGYRIEPGEIEGVLADSGLVRQCVVRGQERPGGNSRLVGYVVVEGEFEKERVMEYLRDRLPEYMIPGIWVKLEKLPLTVNGKVDRKALPDPKVAGLGEEEYTGPRTKVEAALVKIWEELLGVQRIGIGVNFFELGGHSLLASRVAAAIYKEFNIKPPIKILFQLTTIEFLAQYIEIRQNNILIDSKESISITL